MKLSCDGAGVPGGGTGILPHAAYLSRDRFVIFRDANGLFSQAVYQFRQAVRLFTHVFVVFRKAGDLFGHSVQVFRQATDLIPHAVHLFRDAVHLFRQRNCQKRKKSPVLPLQEK